MTHLETVIFQGRKLDHEGEQKILMGTPGTRDEQIPLLSVVVPVYGVERYLDDCLNSLVDQGVSQEIIVVIDASPDRSVAIAREFEAAYDQVRVVENPVNVGLGAARNVGLRQARGKYVTFPDSDDMVAPGAYAALVASLERSGSDFATAYADEFGTSSGRHRYWTTRPAVYATGAEGATLADLPELVYDHTAWTKVFRREFLVHEDIRWPEDTKCEDVVPSMRAYAAATAFDVVPRCLYLYRRRPGSITTGLTSSRTILDWAVQVREALRVLEGVDVPEAVQLFVEKVLRYEVASRLKSLREVDGDTRATATTLVTELFEASEAATLRRVPTPTLTAALALLAGPEPEPRHDGLPVALREALGLVADAPGVGRPAPGPDLAAADRTDGLGGHAHVRRRPVGRRMHPLRPGADDGRPRADRRGRPLDGRHMGEGPRLGAPGQPGRTGAQPRQRRRAGQERRARAGRRPVRHLLRRRRPRTAARVPDAPRPRGDAALPTSPSAASSGCGPRRRGATPGSTGWRRGSNGRRSTSTPA